MSNIRPINIRAEFSSDRKYRYLWEAQIINRAGNGKPITFLMLNPSKADENSTDPTIDKCLAYAYALGYSTLRVVNLFAHCASKPKDLPKDETAVGPCNNSAIGRALSDASLIVCAWGNGHNLGRTRKRAKKVRKLLEDYRERLYCLGLNKSCEPKHPLPRKLTKLTVVRKNKLVLEPYDPWSCIA